MVNPRKKTTPLLSCPLLDASEAVRASPEVESEARSLPYNAILGLWSAHRALLSPQRDNRTEYLELVLSNVMTFLQSMRHHCPWLPWDEYVSSVAIPRKKSLGPLSLTLLLFGECQVGGSWASIRRIAQDEGDPSVQPADCSPLVSSVRAAMLAAGSSREHWERFVYLRPGAAPTPAVRSSLEVMRGQLAGLLGRKGRSFARSLFDPSNLRFVASVTEKHNTLVGLTGPSSASLAHSLHSTEEQSASDAILAGILLPAMVSLLGVILRGAETGALPWKKDGICQRFEDVADAHRLDPDELLVLKMVYQWDNCLSWVSGSFSSRRGFLWKPAPGPSSLARSQGEKDPRPGEYRRKLLQYLCCVLWTGGGKKRKDTPATASDIWCRFLSPSSGTLFSKGLLVAVQPAGAPDAEEDPSIKENCEISIDRTVNAFLEGTVRPPKGSQYSSVVYSRVDMEGSLPLSSHHLPAPKEGALLSTLRMGLGRSEQERGVHILLHGLPGTGKSELARSLAKHLGCALVQPSESMSQFSPYSRFWKVRVASLNLRPGDILLVDEADGILNSGSEVSVFTKGNDRHVSKETMNMFMDKTPGVFIWVSNTTMYIPPSTMRRFDYVLEASMPSRKVRHSIAASMSGMEGAEEMVRRVVDSYPLTAAGLRKVVSLAGVQGDGPRASPEVLEEVAESHLNNGPLSWRREILRSHGAYDPAFVHVSEGAHTLEGLEAKAKRFLAMPEARRRAVGLLNLGILLYGPPGTGKTAWGRYLASALDRPLVEVAASALLDRYVGGTEEGIRKKFQEAERSGAVLLIDEADALLGSRESADKSWEVSQVEQFLYSMESYQGILVCTTNFDSHLDKALLRRFYACLRFGYLGQEAASSMLVRSLEALGLWTGQEDTLRMVAGLSLTPSDFGLASKSLALEEGLSVDMFIRTLKAASESRAGTRRLGF